MWSRFVVVSEGNSLATASAFREKSFSLREKVPAGG